MTLDQLAGSKTSTRFPAAVRAEDAVARVDTTRAPDPDDVRNVDQRGATRDD